MMSNQQSKDWYPLFDWLRISLAIMAALNHDQEIEWRNAGNLAVQVYLRLPCLWFTGYWFDRRSAAF
jgi:hypothetical protein